MNDAADDDAGSDAGDAAGDRADATGPAVEELAEYCRLQAGLLAGRVETMAEEATDRIDEIDEGIAALRSDLDAADGADPDAAGGADPDAADGEDLGHGSEAGSDAGDEAAALADAESDLQRKQAMVEATQSRMRLFQELSAGYLELADDLIATLESGDADPNDAVSRVVDFEAEHDAPAYFEERETLVEVAAGSNAEE
ncbi:hypothetical protein [Halobaculum rubrum]|uniref:hypothetical protein n=1 Tax=Halobaculum rubrum TaxID=2872158 RepID=UPI001CA41D83|nr:hypothetical protein [Halobaculum rubrum]QZX99270.1 hypothetical protein K6T25_13555 [Halobaculum rubrum]